MFRKLRGFKGNVKNKAHVEGSIAEGYIADELVNYCSLYFEEFVDTVHTRLGRNELPTAESSDTDLAVFTYPVKPCGAFVSRCITDEEMDIVTMYVLLNSPEVAPYLT